jgi:PAS domain S-box-containing protein
MPSHPPTSATSTEPQSLWASHALAAVVLVASLVLVVAYWRNVHERGLRDAEADFRFSNRQVIRLLQQRLTLYELLVRGGASLQASLPQPGRAQWQRYVGGLDIETRFPGVSALGFALDVAPEQLGALQPALPGLEQGRASVDRPGHAMHATVLYAAPEQGENRRVPGVDLAQEPGRRAALERSAAERSLRVSGPIPPMRSDPAAPASGFAVYAPVYVDADAHAGLRTGAAASSRQALRGWVFLEVDSGRFVAAALRALEREGQLRLVDIGDGVDRVLHTEPGFLGDSAEGADPSQRPAFVQSLTFDVLGRAWRVDFESGPLEQVRAGIPGLRTTLLGGVAGALLLFGIALSMARTQVRAQTLAARMSESYRRSEQRFRAAMQYSAIGKALLDREGRILEANQALAQILGTTQKALVGTMLGQHFFDGEHDSMRTVEREALAGGAYRITRRLLRSDGDVRHASLTFAMVPSDVGPGFASLVQVDDVTERLRAEARVQALNRTLEARVAVRTRELSHANRELEAFAYSVSHDLRAPLRSIDGFSRLLTERYQGAIDETGRGYLQRIRNASARMSDLIDALLKMSRVSRGELKYVEVDLSAVAREVAAELRNAEPQRQVAFEIQPGLAVRGDPALLRTLMDNLLGNAWKFTRGRDQARIEVGALPDGELFVRDNGAGFAPEYAAKLFRPFQRLHSESEYPGHGIGLATVKRIVERHGGNIRAEGAVEQGATFWFSLGEHPIE